jgi:hypothetical protein
MSKNNKKAGRSGVTAATKQEDLLQRPTTQLWRLAPAAAFDLMALREMRATLSTIAILEEPTWRSAAGGNAAAAIGLALRLNPARSTSIAYDLIVTALAICAAEGNAAACIVMSHILRKLPGAGKAEHRIATSWLVHGFSGVLSRRAEGAA